MSTNLSPVGGAAAQFLDNNGNPLTGGKLFTYAAGTTTPQATFTTFVGNVAHSNPIILDAAGRVPSGEIWLTATLDYKFTLTTSADVPIATWDNILGINGTGLATNANAVAYDPAGLGAVQRTVESKLRESVSVKDFGAVGNGIADDTVAIQNAIDAVYATGDYGEVIIPPSTGEYIFTSILVKSKITLKSTGGELKLRDNYCTNPAVSYYLIHNLGHDRVTYDGLIVIGNRSGGNTQYTVADAITAVGFRTIVKNCTVFNPPDSGIMFSDCIRGACIGNYVEAANDVGIYVNGGVGSNPQQSIIANNRIHNCVVTGIALKREARNVLVTGNLISNCPNSISHEDFGVGQGGHPSEITITNNLISDNGSNSAFALNRLTNSVVSNNLIIGTGLSGITIQGGVNSVISGNVITGSSGVPTTAAGILVSSRVDPGNSTVTVPSKLTISNNSISDYLGKGIYFLSGTNITISGNNVDVGNEGLRLNSGVTGALVQGNIVDGTPDTSLFAGAFYIQKSNTYSGVLADGHRTISAAQPLPTNPASTVTALYIGEEVLHLAANQWFKAWGTGLQEWSTLN
jgi:hypothetical protein